MWLTFRKGMVALLDHARDAIRSERRDGQRAESRQVKTLRRGPCIIVRQDHK
ncbi:hypothetical protein KSC_071230 [Ktedonobacter sp. SOSP1-52]|nr:hypothetical protein KSC_071230 [Ktedonobacter sp. SOSP1-52]